MARKSKEWEWGGLVELLENKRQNNQEQRFLRQSGKFEIHVTGIINNI